jgi:hypothetical protein
VEWEETAGKCIHSFRDELQPYMISSGGPLTGYGYDRGYIFVAFDPKSLEDVNNSIIDEIYLIIEDHCEQEGVNEIPVVFEWKEAPINNLAPADGPDANESNNANLSDKGKIVGNEKTNKTPGFTSIMLILGLLS